MLNALITGAGARVSDLVGGHHWPSEIAWTVRSPESGRPPSPGGSGASPDVAAPGLSADMAASYAELEPGLGFAEWRLEVLSLLETT